MRGFNLSTYYYTDKKVSSSLYLGLSLFILFFTVYNLTSFLPLNERVIKTSKEVASLKKDLSSLRGKLAKRGGLAKESAKEKKKLVLAVEEINAIIEKKSFSWSELFYSLEKASPEGISISRITPSYKSKKIRITGLARNLDELTAFVNNLQDTTYIKKSFLSKESHQLVDKRYSARSFEIEAEGKF